MFFPVSVYLERVGGPDLYRGLLIQGAWVVAAYLLARLVWSRGIRKYSAVGG
jgi:ABC-2 type transport system permease protein